MKLKKTLLDQLLKNESSTVVVINESGDPLYVIIPYKSYILKNTPQLSPLPEQSKRLTSEQLIDKINQELAQWYEQQNQTEMEDDYFVEETFQTKGEEQEQLYLETIDE